MKNLDLAQLREYFRFPFKDREASNAFLIGAALFIGSSIIPIIPMIPALGYQYRLMRRVIDGEGPGMPPWQDWGRLFIDGLKLAAISFIYLAPGMFVSLGGFTLYFITVFRMALAGDNPSSGDFTLMMIGMAFLFLGMTLGMLLFLLGGLPLPTAAAHAIAQDRLTAALNIGQWTRIIRYRPLDFAIGWVILFGLSGLLYFVYMILYSTVVLCLVTPLVLGAFGFYALLVSSAFFAEIYRQSACELGIEIIPEGLPGPPVPAPVEPLQAPVQNTPPDKESKPTILLETPLPMADESSSIFTLPLEESALLAEVDENPVIISTSDSLDANASEHVSNLLSSLPPVDDWPAEDPDPNRTRHISADNL